MGQIGDSCHLRDTLHQSPRRQVLGDCLTLSKTSSSQNKKYQLGQTIWKSSFGLLKVAVSCSSTWCHKNYNHHMGRRISALFIHFQHMPACSGVGSIQYVGAQCITWPIKSQHSQGWSRATWLSKSCFVSISWVKVRIRKSPASRHGSYLTLPNPSHHRCGFTKRMAHRNLLPTIPYVCLPIVNAQGPRQCSEGCCQRWTWESIVFLCFRGCLDVFLVDKSSLEYVRMFK